MTRRLAMFAVAAAVLVPALAAAPAHAASAKAQRATTATVRRPVTTTVKPKASTPTTVKRAATTLKRTGATTSTTAKRSPVATVAPDVARDLFARVNQERLARGTAPLVWDQQLAALATDWSGRLAANPRRFEHRNLAAALRLPQLDAFSSVGENIATMPPRADVGQQLHNLWMHSDPHRANLLQPGWDTIGIGVVCANGTAYATQNFGRQLASQALPAIKGTPPLQPLVATGRDGLVC